MNNMAIADQMDTAISALLADPGIEPRAMGLEFGELLSIAAELRTLPSEEFRAQLKSELLEKANAGTVVPMDLPICPPRTKPEAASQRNFSLTLLGNVYDYPVQPRCFAASFLAQAAVIFLVVGVGVWAGSHDAPLRPTAVSHLISSDMYVLPAAKTQAGGGGGGGDRDRFPASKGALPRAAQEQITPPMIVARNQDAKLTVEPTVVAPPNITFPQNGQLGDPLSAATLPSNGTGGNGGSGSHGGVGPGEGPGVGPGYGGGYGGGPYRGGGGGVSAPRAIYDPEPEYSDEARKAKFQGSVVLSVVIDAEGRTRDIRVARSLGMGLDEQAVAAVRNWRFDPGMKDGHPVAVLIDIVVDFRLY